MTEQDAVYGALLKEAMNGRVLERSDRRGTATTDSQSPEAMTESFFSEFSEVRALDVENSPWLVGSFVSGVFSEPLEQAERAI